MRLIGFSGILAVARSIIATTAFAIAMFIIPSVPLAAADTMRFDCALSSLDDTPDQYFDAQTAPNRASADVGQIGLLGFGATRRMQPG